MSAETLAINSHWGSVDYLRYYLTNGRAWILQLRITTEDRHRLRLAAERVTTVIESQLRS